MTRDSREPGYHNQAARDLAAGLVLAIAASDKAKAAAKKAAEDKQKANDLKGVQKQIELLTFEKQRQSGLRTYWQNLFNATTISNPSSPLIADYTRNFTIATNNITKIDRNIKEQKDEEGKILKSLRNPSEERRSELRVKNALQNAKNKKGNSSNTRNTSPKPPPPAPPDKPMRWNAPMVKSAYFSNQSMTEKIVAARAVTPMLSKLMAEGTFGNGQTNRGFIVPNKKAIQAALSKLDPPAKKVAGGFKVPYGFRFHYNPQFIDQTIGTLNGISPELLMSGKDQANMITTPSASSTISFQLYLNRIEDMNALANYALGPDSKKINDNKDSLIHYPEEVTAADRKLIRDFGTMYDLDFLFKAVNGELGGYTSPLRGVPTGDVGWLNGMAVEMHLGRKLRYLARIINISIKHILFTESMIPTLSVVTISAHRFHDTTTIDTQN